MQYITQLALAARHTPTTRALANENNFTFYPGLLKSSRCVTSSPKKHQSSAHARLIADSSKGELLVEPIGIEPMTSCLQSRRSPN